MAQASRDENYVPTLLAVSNVDGSTPITLYADPTTHRLLVDLGGGGSGTVTSVSVVSANGFAGTVANATTTPAITLTTTVTGILKGNGTAISAITVGTGLSYDGTTLSATGVAGSIVVGTTTITSGTDTRILYDNAGVLGEYTITGSGTVVAMAAAPTFTSSITLGTAGGSTGSAIFTGTTSGAVTLKSADAAGTWTLTLPTNDGDNGQYLQTNGSGVTSWAAGTTTAAGGSNTQVQYNNSSAFGGITNATSDGTTLTITSGRATTDFSPSSNDGATLGTTSLGFADLHMATGGTINFANGNWVATHSSGILTVSTGDLRVTTAGTNTASVVTVGGTQTLTSKTLTSPAITTGTYSGAQLLAEGASIALDPTLSADGTYSGITISGTAGATLAFGDVIYLAAADSRWELADADAAATAGAVLVGFCVLAAAADGDPTVILLKGNIRADAAFPALTVSAPVYISTSPGDVTTTAPSATDDVVRVLGFGLTADSMIVDVSPDYITIV